MYTRKRNRWHHVMSSTTSSSWDKDDPRDADAGRPHHPVDAVRIVFDARLHCCFMKRCTGSKGVKHTLIDLYHDLNVG